MLMAVAGATSAMLRVSVASTSVPEVRFPKATLMTSVPGTTPAATSLVELLTIHRGGIHCMLPVVAS
jgi:hypothetical protein